jgi:acyl-CoA synthetase (NDP forming)
MTTLQEIMSPKSIAIVGASDNKARIGGRPLAHMIEQKFSGGIFPINPNRESVQGIRAYSSLLDVKEDLDFILVAVPSQIVVSVLEQAVEKKAKTALIFSSGFSEIGGQGQIYHKKIKKISKLNENKKNMHPIICINKLLRNRIYTTTDYENSTFQECFKQIINNKEI